MSNSMTEFKTLLAKVAIGTSLSQEESEQAFDIIMSGEATPAQIGGFLMMLRLRGESVDEITGAARIMRAKATHIEAPEGAIDTCGTGGDAKGTLNISTGASLVVAACGVPVAKHGNRALSSKTGAADVLTALGVNIDADFALIKKSLWENNIGFLMAPRHHSAMRNVGGVRVELGTRTIFNLIGPLSSPAGVKRQIVGVFAKNWIVPMAEVLGNLGVQHAWVVHGEDGLDEMTTTGTTHVAELRDGKVATFEITPEQAGLPRAKLEHLLGGAAEENAAAMRSLLEGTTGPFRDIVLYTSAGALIVAGKAKDLRDGVTMAAKAIDSGAAKLTLESMVATSNQVVPRPSADS